ncbi:MAG: GC-type dockerin domain-anchored protein [Phycisphaerales bacterium]
MQSSLLGLLMAASMSVAASADLVVGNDQSGTATIWHVNVTTGAATPLYASTGNEAKPWGMAYDHTTGTLYWNNGANLYNSPFAATLAPSAPVVMTFGGENINFVGLAWRGGRLLGTRNITTEAVYEIDPATGVATQVYIYPTTFDFGGLDVDLTNGKLYGLSDTAPAGGTIGLYEIDTAAMTTTFRAPYPAGETDIDGLAVYNGLAYYVSDGPNTAQANFYVYDIATGAQVGTLPSPFTGTGTFSAAAFVPTAARGACCSGSTCSIVAAAGCTGAGTRFVGIGTSCNMPGDLVSPCCFADFNQDGGATVQDIFDYLTAYFTNSALADINGGGVTVQDIFDYLLAYFRGC